MPVAIIDSFAIAELDGVILADYSIQAYERLAESVKRGELIFPDDVKKDCVDFLKAGSAGVWAVSSAGIKMENKFPGNMPMTIMDLVPDLLDPEDAGRQSGISVVCLAYHRRQDKATVVSEDLGGVGDRISLPDACKSLGIRCLSLAEYLRESGMPSGWWRL